MNSSPATAWDATLSIVERLRAAGHIALLAGGCVRDRLLGREPQDYDVATDALPGQVCAMFPRARLVGVKFGVVVVQRLGHQIEVATFRSDGSYSDGRRPDEVIFGNERGDALRRDFTINGLFYDPIADQVIDYVAGQADIQARVIRAIGDPGTRFREDHLRMLRAVRLSARLGFAIEPQTAEAIQTQAHNLRAISPERIWMELEQILSEPSRARGWEMLGSLGLRPHLCREWAPEAVSDHLAAKRLEALPRQNLETSLALAAAFGQMQKEQIEQIGRGLRLSNEIIDQVHWLIGNLPAAHRAGELELADFKLMRASSLWPQMLELLRADSIANGVDLSAVVAAKTRGLSIPQERAAPPPLVMGEDLLQLGVPAGPAMGHILREVYRAQLNETIESREQGLILAQALIHKSG